LASKKISMRLPEDLLEQIDLISSVEAMDRTELTKQAVKDYIAKLRRKTEFKEHAVELFLSDEITFEALKVILGREDASAVRASKEVMAQGEQLARRLA